MKTKKGKADMAPVRLFANRAAWDAWLEKNHRKSEALWLRLAKKGSGIRSVTSSCKRLHDDLAHGGVNKTQWPA